MSLQLNCKSPHRIKETTNVAKSPIMHFDHTPSDEEMLAFVEAWIDDLARGDYETAFSRTEHDPYYAWSAELIRAVIQGYGQPEPVRDGTVYHVTPRKTARGELHNRKVDRKNVPARVIAEVWYDLPLNGEWSDLTATFRVEPQGGGCAVVLQEIHVF